MLLHQMYDVVYIVKYNNSDFFFKDGAIFVPFFPQFFDTNGQLSTRLAKAFNQKTRKRKWPKNLHF
jgi:hypothetical protein